MFAKPELKQSRNDCEQTEDKKNSIVNVIVRFMQISKLFLMLSGVCLVALPACTSLQSDVYRHDAVADNGEPGYVTVQHCLIGFQGTVGGITRTQEEAQALAEELFEKAQAGEDFDKIVRKYTDDSHPGIYRLANHGFRADDTPMILSNKVFERGTMVPAFGNVGFQLQVGEVGLADYSEEESRFGWHIIKRIE